MKILIALLSHSKSQEKLQACLDTWVKNCIGHDLIILGDSKMPDSISNFEVYKALDNEEYKDLPHKIKLSFRHCLKKNWDYLVKIYDDAYLNIHNLLDFLKNNKNDKLYAGQGIHFPEKTHPCYLSNIGDTLPPKSFKYYYAQGGCYVLSRLALESCIDKMETSSPFVGAEDTMIGNAIYSSGLNLTDRPDIFSAGYTGKGWGSGNYPMRKNTLRENIELIKKGYISTHKLTASHILEIHKHYNLSKKILLKKEVKI